MVPHITTILQRLTGEWALLPQPEALLAVCREIGYTGWRDRVLTPVTGLQLCMPHILHGHTAYSPLLHLSGVRFSAAAYWQARARLPRRLFARLLERFSRAVQQSAVDDGRWQGHRTFLAEGAGGSMPDPRRYRPPAASRIGNGRGAAFPSRGSWGCFMPAPVCSCSWWSRPCSPRIALRYRRSTRPATQGTASWPIAAGVRLLISPSSARVAYTPCGASVRASLYARPALCPAGRAADARGERPAPLSWARHAGRG
jgi:hypothetical protein